MKIPCLLVGVCLLAINVYGQWNSTDPAANIYRSGNVSIGASTPSNDEKLAVESDRHWQVRIRDIYSGGADWRIGASSDSWGAGPGKFLISNSLSSSEAAFSIDGLKNISVAGKLKVLSHSNPINFTSNWSGSPDTDNQYLRNIK